MKRISFSFVCDKDPMKMEASGNTRHCTSCEKQVADFTTMTPREISEYVKNTAHPCGFMRPWQLHQVNTYLNQQQGPFMGGKLNRLARIAAVVAAPLVVTTATAQACPPRLVTPNQQSQPNPGTLGENQTGTEVALRSEKGMPLHAVEIGIYSENELLMKTKTDVNGKIYLGDFFSAYKNIVLKNEQLGIEKNIALKGENICLVWETNLPDQTETEKKWAYDFRFMLADGNKTQVLRGAQVSVRVFDSLNVEIKTFELKTDHKGHLDIDHKLLQNGSYLSFYVQTKEISRSTWSVVNELDVKNPNILTVERYEEILMGIMVAE